MSYTIKRNDTEKTLSEQVFGKKSDHAGVKFFAPVLTRESLAEDIKWIGEDQLIGMANKNLRLVFADIFLDNIKRNEGQFNEEEFLVDAADFTAARQSLQDIQDEIDDLQALQITYLENPLWAEYDDTAPLTEEQKEIKTLMSANGKKIKELRVKKEGIEKEYAIRAEKRKITKAAKEAKAKEAGAVTETVST